MKIGGFFEAGVDRLASADFADVLIHDLGDVERFEWVEQKVRAAKTQLRLVQGTEQTERPSRPRPETKP